MSNILRGKQGNLSKIKYFLPTYHHPQQQSALQEKVQNKKNQTKKKSVSNLHTRSLNDQGEISFEIVGISQADEGDPIAKVNKENKENNIMKINDVSRKLSTQKHTSGIKVTKNGDKNLEVGLSTIRALTNSRDWQFPEGKEKEEFLKFI